jgi:histidinol-phosphate aminotransferase
MSRREPVRLHLSESTYGASAHAVRAAHAALERVNVYPDPNRAELTDKLAERWRLPRQAVAVANGSDELVLLCAIALGQVDKPGLTTAATFPGYRICLEATRRGAHLVPLDGARVDVDAVVRSLADAGIAFLCNPHNPTGAALDRAGFDAVAAAAERTGVPVVVDEAYAEFAAPGSPSVRDYLDAEVPMVALRTFSKAYGLAGLRIGCAIGRPDLIARVITVQETMPFSANRVAQAAALAALDDPGHVDSVRERNAARRDWFTARSRERGYQPLPSVTNFVTLPVPDSAAVEARLAAEYGILTRDTGRFGLVGHLRVSLGERDDLIRLLDALDALEAQTRLGPGIEPEMVAT